MFGGYWGFQAAPLNKINEQAIVLNARNTVQAEVNAQQEADLEEQQREIESRSRRRY